MPRTVICHHCGEQLTISNDQDACSVVCSACRERVYVPQLIARPPTCLDPNAPQAVHFDSRPEPPPRIVSRTKRNKKWLRKFSIAVILLSLATMGFGTFGLWRLAGTDDFSSERDFFKVMPLPQFPSLDSPTRRLASGVQIYEVDTALINSPGPGKHMQFRIFMPHGVHPPRSLRCVLIPPSGSNLLSGAPLDRADYFDECLPFAEAGMAVVHYSLDGAARRDATDSTSKEGEQAAAYLAFMKAQAGIVNGRNAIEFVIQKLPQVNPKRIYVAGHGSAGTAALLLTSQDNRIRGCIALSPIVDVESYHASIDSRRSQRAFPSLRSFLKYTSPLHYPKDFQVPIFLFHARDDSAEQFGSTQQFARVLESLGVDTIFLSHLERGNSDSFKTYGIPQAVQWLKRIP